MDRIPEEKCSKGLTGRCYERGWARKQAMQSQLPVVITNYAAPTRFTRSSKCHGGSTSPKRCENIAEGAVLA